MGHGPYYDLHVPGYENYLAHGIWHHNSGKSYLAMAAAISIASGHALFGTPLAKPGPVLYLDWETDQYTHAERLRALCRGAGIAPLPPIYYRHMVGGLRDALPAVQREVADLGVVAAIIDSLATARGGEPESAAETNTTMTAVRGLRPPCLIVDHVSKAVMQAHERTGRLSPFGSIYTENRARNTWSVRRAGEEAADDFVVALIHEKTNNGRYQRRHALKLTFANTIDDDGEDRLTAVSIQPWNIADVPDFEGDLPMGERILRFLAAQPECSASPEEFATAVGKPVASVRPRFTELKDRGKVIYLKDRGKYGLASPQQGAAS